MPIQKILVPTDFSENAQVAFKWASNLARQLGAELVILHVQDESTLRFAVRESLLREDSTDEELQAQVAELIEKRFSKMLDRVGSDVKAQRLNRRGDPKAVIVEVASELHADLVVVGMSGQSAMEKLRVAMLGSVAESVMRKSPCPTVVVRTDHKDP